MWMVAGSSMGLPSSPTRNSPPSSTSSPPVLSSRPALEVSQASLPCTVRERREMEQSIVVEEVTRQSDPGEQREHKESGRKPCF